MSEEICNNTNDAEENDDWLQLQRQLLHNIPLICSCVHLSVFKCLHISNARS